MKGQKKISIIIMLVLIIFGNFSLINAEQLIKDAVICKDLKTIIKLNRTIAINDYSFMLTAIQHNLCRRCTNASTVRVKETYKEFSKISGIYIAEMPRVFYWTYTSYLKK